MRCWKIIPLALILCGFFTLEGYWFGRSRADAEHLQQLEEVLTFVRQKDTEVKALIARMDSVFEELQHNYVHRPISGFASYYAEAFHGRPTANQETFDMNDMTAASPGLPFGTLAFVLNLRNGRTTLVRINDRGPFVEGRVIDLSKAAAAQLGMLRDGVVRVKIFPLLEVGG